MNILQQLARKIIKVSFDFSISVIEFFSDIKPYKQKVSVLRKLDNGTLGKEIATCLDSYNLNLVPKFESHDLKHVLFAFKMTPEDEIRMQAFMIGNGNYSIPSFSIFIFGAILLPELWIQFYKDFKKGRNTVSVSNWQIKDYATRNLDELRKELVKPVSAEKPLFDIQKITKIGAFASIIAGIFGILFCLPFLFSSNVADLVGAGFPFVGGAILFIGGLLVLSNLSKTYQGNLQVSLETSTNYLK